MTQLVLGVLLVSSLFPVSPDDPSIPLSIARTSGAITFDGHVDDAAWQQLEPLPMTMYQPTFQGTPTEQTEVRITFDDTYLYIAGRMYDAEPDAIRITSLYRDDAFGDDRLGFMLDTFNDNKSGLHFFTNAAGVRNEVLVSDDGGSFNVDWNTYWDVATVRDATGWTAEIRIPFSSLGFQTVGDQVTMGLMVYRDIPRRNERYVFPSIPPDWSVWTPSQAQKITLAGVTSHKPVYVTPYVLGGLGQTAQPRTNGTGFFLEEQTTQDVGLDLKYHVTSNLTLDATINTDFAQAEADDQQVNLTRFSLFFPEKRQFFQERSSVFAFRTLGFDRLFHSRRIGLYQGEAIPLLGGGRLVGRIEGWDVGILNMQTARRGTLDLPSENFGVVRLRRQVFNPFSNAGGMLTTRLGDDGSYNVVYGLDGEFRLFGFEYLTLKWAQSFDQARSDNTNATLGNTGHAYAEWERRRLEGWSYYNRAVWSGRNFEPGLGFLQRRDYFGGQGLLHLNTFPGDTSPFFRTMPFHIQYNVALRNNDRSVESFQFNYDVAFWGKRGMFSYTSLAIQYEDLRRPLFFSSDVFVPEGDYTFVNGSTMLQTRSGQPWQATIQTGVQSFYDGWRTDASVSGTWNQSRHVSFQATYALNTVHFPDRDQQLNAHIVRLRIQSALDTRLSLNAFIQYNSAADFISTNVRFRYNVREGNDLWIVYNEGLNTDRHRDDLNLPLTNDRTLLLKYTYTFGV